MNETELKQVIAMLLEDAKRLQQVEPNAGTEARIAQAQCVLYQEVQFFIDSRPVSKVVRESYSSSNNVGMR